MRVALLCLALVACGASQQETTLRATLVALNTAEAALVAYDAQHQSDIVSKATSAADGRSELDAYRLKRAKVVDSILAAYRAEALAAVIKADDKSLATLLYAAGIVESELRELGVIK